MLPLLKELMSLEQTLPMYPSFLLNLMDSTGDHPPLFFFKGKILTKSVTHEVPGKVVA